MEEAYNYLLNEINIKYGDSVVLGVSGGPDSMALLHLMTRLKKALDINDEEKAKKYSQDLIYLENEMGKYIIKNEKLINRIDFSIESSRILLQTY